ncbi:MAG: hypothetical protein LBS93_02320 [Synergistaceae bacterium]|jgi:hypothetical protein|nr:hypothetical protein [Synergistaceae bacterium]
MSENELVETKQLRHTLLDVTLPRQEDSIDLSEVSHPEFIRVPVFDADTCAGTGCSHDNMDVDLVEYVDISQPDVGLISVHKLSVRVNINDWRKLNFENLENIDPIEALASFDLRRDMSHGYVFKTIEPF